MWVGHVIWHPGHYTDVLSFIFHHGMLILSPWLVMMMRTVAGVDQSRDSASRSHDTKPSVIQDPKVSGHYFVFQHRASRNVNSVSMVGYDNDCSLERRGIIRLCNILQKRLIAEFKMFLTITFSETCFPKVTSPDTVR